MKKLYILVIACILAVFFLLLVDKKSTVNERGGDLTGTISISDKVEVIVEKKSGEMKGGGQQYLWVIYIFMFLAILFGVFLYARYKR